MPNNANYTMESDTDKPDASSMAWFLPTFVGVFMVIFLLVSWVFHHRRFRERYKHRELLEYYLELQVDYGRRRVATPTTSSSVRHKDNEVDFSVHNLQTIASPVARSSLGPAINTAVKENDTGVTNTKRTKRSKKPSKVAHKDSGFLKLFAIPSSKPSTNGECFRISDDILSPIARMTSSSDTQTLSLKDEKIRSNPDSVLRVGSHKCIRENCDISLKASSLPLDPNAQGESHLKKYNNEETTI